MTASAATQKHDFIGLLAAPGRSPEIPEENDVYGWLVGSWNLEALHYAATDVAPLHIQGEVHFGWVLEGRAIQDVWIMPRVSERNANLAKTNNMYGTTLRIWDASIQSLAHPLDQSRNESLRTANRPPRRPPQGRRYRAGRRTHGRHADALAIHRNHAQLVPLDRRIAESRRRHLEARRRIPLQAYAMNRWGFRQ